MGCATRGVCREGEGAAGGRGGDMEAIIQTVHGGWVQTNYGLPALTAHHPLVGVHGMGGGGFRQAATPVWMVAARELGCRGGVCVGRKGREGA